MKDIFWLEVVVNNVEVKVVKLAVQMLTHVLNVSMDIICLMMNVKNVLVIAQNVLQVLNAFN